MGYLCLCEQKEWTQPLLFSVFHSTLKDGQLYIHYVSAVFTLQASVSSNIFVHLLCYVHPTQERHSDLLSIHSWLLMDTTPFNGCFAMRSVLSWPSAASRLCCTTKFRHFKQGRKGNSDRGLRYEVINHSVVLYSLDVDVQTRAHKTCWKTFKSSVKILNRLGGKWEQQILSREHLKF